MKKILFIVCFFSLNTFASGPEVYEVDVNIKGVAIDSSESLACSKARHKAMLDYEVSAGDEYSDGIFCFGDDSESYIKESLCMCSDVSYQHFEKGYRCEYEAVAVCFEQVWYN